MADHIDNIIAKLSKQQKYHVERGCMSGDFSMVTVYALRRKGLMYLRLDSPSGTAGLMELTDLGKSVRTRLTSIGGDHG